MRGLWTTLLCLCSLTLGGQAGLPPLPGPKGPTFLQPGRPRFRVQGVREGLPHSTIMAITLDRVGQLWVGTQDGAASYDGQQWTVVNMPDREVSNYIHAVLAASDGSLWFGRQDGGVARLHQGVWSRWTQAEGLPANRVNALLQTPDGLVWAATHGGGLARWDGRGWTPFAVPLRSRRLWKLTASTEDRGAFWVCGEGGTLVRVKGGQAEAVEGLPALSVNQVLEHRDARGQRQVWVSTYGGGVGRWQGGGWRFFRQADGLPDDFCTDLAETLDVQGRRTIWAATLGGLAFLEEGSERWQAYTHHSGLPTESIYQLLVHHPAGSGRILWIGTSGAGLASLEEGGWLTHDGYSGLSGHVAQSMMELPRPGGASILAATSLGLSEFNGREWRDWALPPALARRRIHVVARLETATPSPSLWVAGLGALGRWRNGRWTLYGEAQGMPNPSVWTFAESEAGGRPEVWAGTPQGPMALEGERWRNRAQDLGLPQADVYTLLATRSPEGLPELWMGIQGEGLVRYAGKQVRRLGRAEGLPNTLVTHLLMRRGPEGRRQLWVGTNGGGVAIYDPEDLARPPRLLSARTAPALLSPAIQALAEDRAGNVYIATNQGVVRVREAPGADGQPWFVLRYFTEDDGLPSNNATPRAILVDSRDQLWVGTRSGIGVLSLRRIPEETSTSLLRIHRVWVNGELRPALLDAGPGNFAPQENRLSLGYALMTFHGEQAIQYQTQLAGMEPQPTEWGAANQRQFGVLPPGRYEFLVWARDSRGRTTGPARWAFRIRPTLWQRTGFRILLVLAGLALLGWAVRWRLRWSLRQNEALRRLVGARTRELERLNENLVEEIRERRVAEGVKDEFTALVSHELRTPLTSIRGSLGLLGVPGLGEDHRQELHQIALRNTERLLNLVNDLLDMRRIEQGHLDLQPQSLPLGPSLAAALLTNGTYASQFEVSLVLQKPVPPVCVWADPLRLEQVMANLLSNAAKYSPPREAVLVGAEEEGPQVRVWVRNVGEPIPEAFRPQIFQKFAQADTGDTRAVKGTGLGLAITRAIVEAMGGGIGFASGPGATTFWFTLPRA